jgi:hypothetical protein
MAGFEVTTNGRFWVTAEDCTATCLRKTTNEIPSVERSRYVIKFAPATRLRLELPHAHDYRRDRVSDASAQKLNRNGYRKLM